ncbi:fumarylacetoacetate hydrolase [Nakamurella panacisegetis]|uniref:fumarylacetoacetase n=1 Tax=Nakamurella panacisegetis TaxID=1090615 RepID=A0A1H0N737_9ACTN|nr:fumarylacetoacetate hydrolase family protein [Nakamurella panacisegetis]SDO88458.1 fumarylacetoacetate hydrolase [Nakamurella panacisegetis]
MDSWLDLDPDAPFGLGTLPYGVVSPSAGGDRRVAVAIGGQALDLAAAAGAGILGPRLVTEWFAADSLNRFMSTGPTMWRELRERLVELLSASRHQDRTRGVLVERQSLREWLPWDVTDYVDFYSFEAHAKATARIFRPSSPELPPSWRSLPIGYHGRAGSVVVSGTEVTRPRGQYLDDAGAVVDGPTRKLDIEAEVGFVVGVGRDGPARLQEDVLEDHVFGVVLVNDWSARDVQRWEYVPLGPFLGKSFATSVSAWVTPLVAFDQARVEGPPQDPLPPPYLAGCDRRGIDLRLRVDVNTTTVAEPPFEGMYWSPAQQLAHLTSNGARLRTGDLYASGTVSGWEPGQAGSLLEASLDGTVPVVLDDGTQRGYLRDGDTVTITARTGRGPRVDLGPVVGRVRPPLAEPF